MKIQHTIALAVAVGLGLGVIATRGLAAQAKRTFYVADIDWLAGKQHSRCRRAPCQSLDFFKDLIGRLHEGYIAASSLPLR